MVLLAATLWVVFVLEVALLALVLSGAVSFVVAAVTGVLLALGLVAMMVLVGRRFARVR